VPEALKPSIYNIAAHGGFADALAQGLIDRFGKEPLGLAKGLIILPNNRAKRAVQDAFVRLSESGLLLPQIAVLGDLELDESIGLALDSGEIALDIPPAVNPLDRLLIIARIIEEESDARKQSVLAKEAIRLAREFTRTMDQLTVEEIALAELIDLDVGPELSQHWLDSLAFFRIVIERWQERLSSMSVVDEATRRNALFDATTNAWKKSAPNDFVVAAGITTSAPSIARLLRQIAFMEKGMVVLPDLDLIMPDEEWNLLGPFEPDAENGLSRPAQETHPQYHMKLLLNRMSIARAEVLRWPRTGESGAVAKRSQALSNAFAIPKLTARWQSLDGNQRSLAGVQTIEAQTSAEEAQSVAISVREALETPNRRIAIITPDRDLATRISAHLKRWKIDVDDTAGQPLSKTPVGILLLDLLTTVSHDFAPAEFLALLKHPLVKAGDERILWLDNVRKLDLLLRGPRPTPGLNGIDSLFAEGNSRTKKLIEAVNPWWIETREYFESISDLITGKASWAELLSSIRELADKLTNGEIWTGPAGRELANFFADMEARESLGPNHIKAEEIAGYFENFLSNISVRPAFGGHPRVALYGLLEARLQQADLVICCGLNEGVWPQSITPDPWLAPLVRRSLGLPAQERQVGLSAHDLVGAMGAKNVVLTRAARDGGGPSLPSRFLLRLKAMCGENLKEHPFGTKLAKQIDKPDSEIRIEQPAPSQNSKQRNITLSVTHVDRLIADPYAFYAHRILKLNSLDMIDADPSAAWRGSIIHDILDKWASEDDYDLGALQRRAHAFLNNRASHPIMRTLWAPRLMKGLLWVAERVFENQKDGRETILSEEYGAAEIAGVQLSGIADRIDRLSDGSLAIVDYKTGAPPSTRAVKEGFSLQLGLLAAIIENSGMKTVSGEVSAFEYWSLAKKAGTDSFGYTATPTKGRGDNFIESDAMVDHAVAHLNAAVDKYILGDEPMTAKLHPEYAPYGDYDQLMRLEEWYGRVAVAEGDTRDE